VKPFVEGEYFVVFRGGVPIDVTRAGAYAGQSNEPDVASILVKAEFCSQAQLEEARLRGEVRDLANRVAERAGSMHIMDASQARDDLAWLVRITEPSDA
jgi:hypothetical protein